MRLARSWAMLLPLLCAVPVCAQQQPSPAPGDTMVLVLRDSMSSGSRGAVALGRSRRDSDPTAFPVPLGRFTTTLAGSLAARTLNVRLAAEALDGLVLEPGDVLSFNAVVGPRSAERGYQPAPVILHETRQLQVGGGVCQVASTVFVAGLLSGLDVAERWRHSSPVDYIATGEDATIAWGAKDLRMRNNSDQRLRLVLTITGATLSAGFDGEAPLPHSLELVTEERELSADADGDAAGREIELYRVLYDAQGGEERTLVHRDVIPPRRAREGNR